MLNEILIAFGATFLVRIVSVTTGGGGSVLIPILISLGLPPSVAVATNRVGAIGTALSVIKYHRAKQVDWKLAKLLIIPTLIGTILGTVIVININQDIFQRVIGLVIILSIPLAFYKNKLGLEEIKISKKRKQLGIILTVLASFMGAVFASTGIWFTYLFLFFGLTMLQSVATRKVIGSIIAVMSVILLTFANLINWPIAIAVFIASTLGAWVGADLGIKVGNLWIRRVFILVAVLLALKILIF